MGTAQTDFTKDSTMNLNKAILIYGDSQAAFATIHDIAVDKGGASTIKHGEPMTHGALATLAMSLGKSVQIGQFLPENILSVGLNSLVWWVPPSQQRTWFKCHNELIGEENAVTPQPALVFGICADEWMVFAVKGNKRPTKDTPLFVCPHFNVWSNGRICQGTVSVPKDYSANSIDAWSKAFFGSAYSHPNVHGKGEHVSYKGGSYQLWRDLLDSKFKKFPEKVLVPKHRTVSDFIRAINQGGTL